MIEDTLRKFVADLEQGGEADSLPLEADYNPLDPENVRAVTTLLSALLFNSLPWATPVIDDVLGHVLEKDSCFAEYIDSLTFHVRWVMQQAAAQWVRNKYGNDPANELEGFLEDDGDCTWQKMTRYPSEERCIANGLQTIPTQFKCVAIEKRLGPDQQTPLPRPRPAFAPETHPQ